MDSYIFFVRSQGVVRAIEMKESEILSDNCCAFFFTKVCSAFEITNEEEMDAKLYTPNKYEVKPSQLHKLLLQFKSCSQFQLDVLFPNGAITNMSHEILKQYLKDHKCEYIFSYHDIRGFLSAACKKELFKQITTFIENTYTLNANEDEIIAVCLAAIKLFPSLETTPSSIGGIDMLYDAGKQCGKIYECLKYRQRRGRDQKRAALNDDDMTVSNIENSVLNVEVEELKEFFSSCVLPRDINKVESKLAETIDARREIIQSAGNSIPKMFNFYWIDTHLILYDFEIMFPNVKSKYLIDEWQRIEKAPSEKYKFDLKDNDPIFHKDLDVHRFFLFLKMLPCHKVRFFTAVKSFMVFSEDPYADPMLIRNKKNNSPHFVFIAHEEEKKFYISACDRLINVPAHFSFIQALDMYYKVHKVFQLPFHKHLTQVMCFIGAFIFGMEDDRGLLTPKSLSFSNIFND